jgi:hypothetical protein
MSGKREYQEMNVYSYYDDPDVSFANLFYSFDHPKQELEPF